MSNLYLNDEFMSQPFKYKYSKNYIEKMYYEYYLFNVKQLIKSNYFKPIFVSVKDVLLRPYTCKKNWDTNTNNITLLKYHNKKIQLGENILEQGTYWPYAFIQRPDVSNYYIKYGNHRAMALKLLQAQKRISSSFSIFGFKCDEQFLKDFAQDNEKSNFHISPIKVILNKEIIERAKIKKRFINIKIIKEIDNFTLLCEINNIYDLWYSCHAYSLFLRNELINLNISPLKIFNNEVEYAKTVQID